MVVAMIAPVKARSVMPHDVDILLTAWDEAPMMRRARRARAGPAGPRLARMRPGHGVSMRAQQFHCEKTLEEILAQLNEMGPWRWRMREGGRHGRLLWTTPSGYVRIQIYGPRDRPGPAGDPAGHRDHGRVVLQGGGARREVDVDLGAACVGHDRLPDLADPRVAHVLGALVAVVAVVVEQAGLARVVALGGVARVARRVGPVDGAGAVPGRSGGGRVRAVGAGRIVAARGEG